MKKILIALAMLLLPLAALSKEESFKLPQDKDNKAKVCKWFVFVANNGYASRGVGRTSEVTFVTPQENLDRLMRQEPDPTNLAVSDPGYSTEEKAFLVKALTAGWELADKIKKQMGEEFDLPPQGKVAADLHEICEATNPSGWVETTK